MHSGILQELEGWLRFLRRTGVDYVAAGKNVTSFLNGGFVQGEVVENDICSSCAYGVKGGRTVRGRGPVPASIMIIGGVPSARDESAGHPFAGEDGVLLAKMLRAINIDIGRVYLTCAVKCRSGGKRDIDRAIVSCRRLLEHEMESVSPGFALLLGDAAARSLLGYDQDFSSLVGEIHDINGCRVMAIHAPSFILSLPVIRQKQYKLQAWNALKKFAGLLRSA